MNEIRTRHRQILILSHAPIPLCDLSRFPSPPSVVQTLTITHSITRTSDNGLPTIDFYDENAQRSPQSPLLSHQIQIYHADGSLRHCYIVTLIYNWRFRTTGYALRCPIGDFRGLHVTAGPGLLLTWWKPGSTTSYGCKTSSRTLHQSPLLKFMELICNSPFPRPRFLSR
jgi:hypothetical protein